MYNIRNRLNVTDHFDALEQPQDQFLVTYVWVDSTGKHVRFKTRTFDFEPMNVNELPWWDHADDDLDRYIQPVRLFYDPFYSRNRNKNKIVLCESFHADRVTIPIENKRHELKETSQKLTNAERISHTHTCVTLKQTFTVHSSDYNANDDDQDDRIEDGHLSQRLVENLILTQNNQIIYNGRYLVEAHYKACLYSGVRIKSYNQNENNVNRKNEWHYEMESFEKGQEAADHLWVSRYILDRIAEELGVLVRFSNLLSNATHPIALISFTRSLNGFANCFECDENGSTSSSLPMSPSPMSSSSSSSSCECYFSSSSLSSSPTNTSCCLYSNINNVATNAFAETFKRNGLCGGCGCFAKMNQREDESFSPPNKRLKFTGDVDETKNHYCPYCSSSETSHKTFLNNDQQMQEDTSDEEIKSSLNTNTLFILNSPIVSSSSALTSTSFEIFCKNRNYDPYDAVNRMYLAFL